MSNKMENGNSWKIKASGAASRTVNPLRAITDVKHETNPRKEVINLSIGDPTAHGNLMTNEYVSQILAQNATSNAHNGYPPSVGYASARAAIALFNTSPEAPLTAADIVLTSGASQALVIAMEALLDPGDNILIPTPGFSLYECVCGSKGFVAKKYNLLPQKSWEVDIQHMKSLIDDKTRAILINSPSNPCGSVYSLSHLNELLAVADEFHVPIISDEIYAGMAFEGHTFYPIASLTKTVPVLTIGGLAKKYLVPGWRVGWIMIHDRNNILDEIRKGVVQLSQLSLGPNSVAQSILPDILFKTPMHFFSDTNRTLQENARYLESRIEKIPGLVTCSPQGAMYMMIEIQQEKFKDFSDDMDFFNKLLAEESIFVLPGSIFGIQNYFRVVICAPISKLKECADRLEEFCRRHAK